MARTKSRAALRSATWRAIRRPPRVTASPKGTATTVTATKKKDKNGARVCRNRSEKDGTKSSLKIILRASAKGWKRPKARTPKSEARLAPMRSCMTALSLRSTQVRTRARIMVQARARTMRTSIMALPQLHSQFPGQPGQDLPLGQAALGRPEGRLEGLDDAIDV